MAPLESAGAEIQGLGVQATATVLDVVGTPLDGISDRDLDWVIGVNLFGVIHGIKALVPRIKSHGQGGQVVNTSSTGGFQVKPGWDHGLYAADANHTPATAVAMATESLRCHEEASALSTSIRQRHLAP